MTESVGCGALRSTKKTTAIAHFAEINANWYAKGEAASKETQVTGSSQTGLF
jgi:hypothetical protein